MPVTGANVWPLVGLPVSSTRYVAPALAGSWSVSAEVDATTAAPVLPSTIVALRPLQGLRSRIV
jgi:hypothetical protein